jgi:hypothetical protein
MFIVTTLPWTLILYLWAVLVWQWWNRFCLSETRLNWQRRPKVPPNAGLWQLHHVIPEVSKTTIHEAVTGKLVYRKLCPRRVPKMLTDDHKTKRMGSALKFLRRYAQEGDEFLDSIVTGDETWCFSPHCWIQATATALTPYASPRHSYLAGILIGAAISNKFVHKKFVWEDNIWIIYRLWTALSCLTVGTSGGLMWHVFKFWIP